jgi:sugar transferase (PEP-CTERM/EpsH1 system associated)
VRIVFISSRCPYPSIQGDRARAYWQLRMLARDHRTTLVTPVESERDRQSLRALTEFCERIEPVPDSRWRRVLRLGRAPFSQLPWQTLYFYDPRLQRKVKDLLDKASYDVVHVQLVRMAPVADRLADIPRVLDLIDALSLNWYRRARHERIPLSWLARLEAERLQRYERALASRFERLIVSSPVDRAAIGPYENLHVVPNGVDTRHFHFVEDGREPNTIIFSGRMAYFPNAVAAIWFAKQVLPLIRRQIPAVRFIIAGADPSRQVLELKRLDGVQVTGYVSDLHELLSRAAVAVAPMQAGSGIQNKVLEAMSSGTPLVATPSALGGIEARDGEHLLMARDGEAVAEQIIRLLQDPSLACRLAHSARSLVEDKYTWDRAGNMLEELYHLAASQEPGGGC